MSYMVHGTLYTEAGIEYMVDRYIYIYIEYVVLFR